MKEKTPKEPKFKKNGELTFLTKRRYKRAMDGIDSLGRDRDEVLKVLKEINKTDTYFINEFMSYYGWLNNEILKLPEFILANNVLSTLKDYDLCAYIKNRVKVLPKEELVMLIKGMFTYDKIERLRYNSGEVTEIANERKSWERGDFARTFGEEFEYLFDEIVKEYKEEGDRRKQQELAEKEAKAQAKAKKVKETHESILSNFN